MSRSRRSFLAATAAAAASAGICPPVRADDLPIRIGATPGAATAEAYYAEQLGYFKRAGLNVTVSQYSRTPDVLQAVVTGSMEIGLTTPETIANAIVHGLPLRAIGTGSVNADPPQIRLCVAKNAPIATAGDLKGGVIGVSVLNDIQTLAVWAWLDKNHIDSRTVRMIEMPFSAMAGALSRGTIQAATIGEPFIAASKDELRAIPGPFELLGTHFAVQAFYTNTAFANKNPDLIASMMEQIYAVAKLVNTRPDSVETLLPVWAKITPDVARTVPKPVFAQAMDESQYRAQLALAAQYKILPRAVTFKELTTN